jgi:hypothetical protein
MMLYIHHVTRQSLDRSPERVPVCRPTSKFALLRRPAGSTTQSVLAWAHYSPKCAQSSTHMCTSVHPTRVHRTARADFSLPTFVCASRSAICRRTDFGDRLHAAASGSDRARLSDRSVRPRSRSMHQTARSAVADARPDRRGGGWRWPCRGGAPFSYVAASRPTSEFRREKVTRRGLDLRLSPAKVTRSAAPGGDRAASEHFFGHIYKEKGCEEESTRDSQPIPRLLR